MNLNDWEFIWKRQALPVGADADTEKLKRTFEASHRRLARALLVRDVTEAGAGVLVSGMFGLMGWHLGRPFWPFAVVVALCLGVTGVFVRERVKARRSKVDPGAPLMVKLESDLAVLRHQRRLLAAIVGWYIAPIFLACMIVMATITARSEPWSPQRDPYFIGGMVLFMLVVNVGVWALNMRAVRRQLDPRIAELEKLKAENVSQG